MRVVDFQYSNTDPDFVDFLKSHLKILKVLTGSKYTSAYIPREML